MTETEINGLSEIAWNLRLNDLQKSYQTALDVLEISESRNYSKGIADGCKCLSYCYWRFSDYSLSLSHSLRALDIYKELGDKKGEADTLNNVGAVYMFQNDNQKRLEVNQRCKELRQEIGDLEGVASSEGNIGETYYEMGDYVNAKACFENCIQDVNASPQGLAWAWHNLGRVESVHENWNQAMEFFQKGLEVSESVNYNVLIVDSHLAITELYIDLKQYEEAILQAEKSLEVSRRIGAKEGEKKSLFFLSKVYEILGNFQKSLKYHKDYHTIDLEISRDSEIERLKTTQLRVAYDKIEDQKNQLVDSIRYAERIQQAVLTRDQSQDLLTKYFVLYKPKDIVSGDFYWYYEKDDHFYMCVADCTGHGVPGALLTMLGTTFLNEIVVLNDHATPAFILERLRTRLIKALSQRSGTTRDGMDISLLRFNVRTKSADWAGAYNPIWVVRSNGKEPLMSSGNVGDVSGESHTLYEIKADKFPIGPMEELKPFTNHSIQLLEGDNVYLFSDGFRDQFGGVKGKKYGSLQLKQKVLSLQNSPIEAQGLDLEQAFDQWKGRMDQLDDVCMFGIEILAPW